MMINTDVNAKSPRPALRWLGHGTFWGAVALSCVILSPSREGVRAETAPVRSLLVPRHQTDKDKPFWKKRPEVLRRIREERAVVVSIRHESLGADRVRFSMLGAGVVRRSKDASFQIAQQYEKLKEVSDHFKTVQFEPQTQQLFIVTEALGYQARMIMKIWPVIADWRNELQWEVMWGHFKGMKGIIGFEGLEDERTEMSLKADYEAAELPLPKALIGFALEVVTQKVAEKMRAFIESQPAEAKPLREKQPPTDERLQRIRLPEGFQISYLSDQVPGARQMSLSPSGTLFIGTRDEGKVYAIEKATEAIRLNQKAAKPVVIASDLNWPNGVAFHEGSLYVAEISRILRFDKIESLLRTPPRAVVLRDDFPKDRGHGWKYIAVGPDGWLYVPVGAPCNVCLSDDPIYASLQRLSLDGKKREPFASGIRNTVGFTWHPRTRELWFTDNGGDYLGDDMPADELNHAPKSGLHFGYPFCHQGDFPDPKFGVKSECAKNPAYRKPIQKLGPHVAALGLKFYTGSQFPDSYRERLFIAEHGSWNRSKKIGYRISMVRLDKNGGSLGYEVFAEGWMSDERSWGRPVDILVAPDGSLLVSDDQAGAIYVIKYVDKKL